MLSILSLCGLALAATLLPTSADDSDDAPKSDSSVESKSTDQDVNAIDSLADNADEAEGDALIGTDTPDVLIGAAGEDTIHGGGGSDLINGGDGDDILYGDDDAEGDNLIGGDGNDTFFAGAGDHIEGGQGDDRFYMDDEGPVFIADYNPDDDWIIIEYDPQEPLPELETEAAEDGIQLFAGQKHVATFGGIAVLDVEKIHLIPDPA